MFKKLIDKIVGTPATVNDTGLSYRPNRKQKRSHQALMLKQKAESRRRKYEKRGAPGRSAKGRKPHRG